jgi:4'-phosphopantetheinyl transferase
VRRLLGSDALDHTLEVERDKWGVPWAVVDGNLIPLSVSHTDGWAAAAAHPWIRVGIDVEQTRELPASFARYFLSPSEVAALGRWEDRRTALLAGWTLKEAALKALGRGLTVPPRTVLIRSMDSEGRAGLTMAGGRLGASCWRDDGAVVAVACAGVPKLPALSISRGGT